VRPGRHDRKHRIRIEGLQLEELKRHALDLPQSFGLDRKIERYQGKRLLGLYRWDLEYLISVLHMALRDPGEYDSQALPRSARRLRRRVTQENARFIACKQLFERLVQEYRTVYNCECL